ncbi:MAG: TIGR03032 family protein [Thermoguttaceae bacterium]|nr:TIGR03032 family protein [Planctomycetaceae bacterium]MBQ4142590.1 TIGR03032 family protein [Thermoguttaceae bacterium]
MEKPNQDVSGSPSMVRCEATDGFKQWMANYGGSIVFTTRRSGKLCLLGWDGRLVTLLQRQMDLPMGVKVFRDQILVSTRSELMQFADAPLLAHDYNMKLRGEYDACYLPRASWFVGELGTGDILRDKDDLLFVNPRFSCVARPSFKYNFEPVWKPAFISELAPEDRCFLSGAASVEGQLAYVTAYSASNEPFGWRKAAMTDGVLIDARKNEIILEGLMRPHSPTWYKECLWFLNSGRGQLCVMHPGTCERKTVSYLPGIARGLAFWGNYAIVGLSSVTPNAENYSQIRKMNNQTFCGVVVVNILTGAVEGMFVFEQGCDEVFDLDLIPGTHRAALLTPNQPKCYDALTMENLAWWVQSND